MNIIREYNETINGQEVTIKVLAPEEAPNLIKPIKAKKQKPQRGKYK